METLSSWNWNAAIAIGAWALVFGTLVSLWMQALFTKRALSAQAFFQLTARWSSSDMRNRRKRLAGLIISTTPTPVKDIPPDVMEDVLGFFEDIGTIVHQKYLDRKPVWQSFSTAVRHYWVACGETYTTDAREKTSDSTLYSEFQYLAEEMEKVEMKTRKKTKAEIRPSTRAIEAFLKIEANLK